MYRHVVYMYVVTFSGFSQPLALQMFWDPALSRERLGSLSDESARQYGIYIVHYTIASHTCTYTTYYIELL